MLAGKQQISSLLEKLTLISTDSTFCQSRYVSGCSANNIPINDDSGIDTEAILKELDFTSRPNIQSTLAFNCDEMSEIYDSLENSKTDNSAHSSKSGTSIKTNFSDFRLGPEGQGNTSDETIFQGGKSEWKSTIYDDN